MIKQKSKRKPKSERLEFVQDYLPIKDLKNGIIETTDGGTSKYWRSSL
jgi:hypothetical protein